MLFAILKDVAEYFALTRDEFMKRIMKRICRPPPWHDLTKGVINAPKTKGGIAVFDRVTFDPTIMGGRACIRGMRITVAVIVSQIAHGASFDDILAGYPDLDREDIRQAIEYAAWLAQERVENA